MKGGDIKQFQELSKQFSLIPLNGKVPIEKNWQQWCEKKRHFNPKDFEGKNAGLCMGPASEAIALDVDDVPKFNKMAKKNNWELPQTRMHLTGTNNPHYIYGCDHNGRHYGNRSFSDPEGEIDPKTGKIFKVFDIKAAGGQVVSPGSIHPDTAKLYVVRYDLPLAPAPQWLLELALNEPMKERLPQQGGARPGDLDSLPVSIPVKKLIREGERKGQRSEAIMSVLSILVRAEVSDSDIFNIFETYPIGEKYREKGRSKEKWLQDQINKVRRGQGTQTKCAIGMTFTDLEKEFSGDIEWLWREHIPKALPSMVNGREGSGKTTLCLQMAKEILKSNPEGMVVWVATEGFVLDTFNKMKEMGIKDRRFQIPKKPDGTYRFNLRLRDDCNYIANYLDQLDQPVLIVFVDSLRGATDFDANEDKMRIPIMNLNTIVCDSHKAACLWIHHFNKTTKGNLLDQSAGSPAITAAVRQVLSVTRKSAYVRSIKQAKSNVGISSELELIKSGKDIIIRQPDQESEEGQTDRAEALLIDIFKDNDTIPVNEIFESAKMEGILEHPLRDAKKRLGMQANKIGNRWFWLWKI